MSFCGDYSCCSPSYWLPCGCAGAVVEYGDRPVSEQGAWLDGYAAGIRAALEAIHDAPTGFRDSCYGETEHILAEAVSALLVR